MNHYTADHVTTNIIYHDARLVCPHSGRDEIGGVLVENGVISDVGPHIGRHHAKSAELVDCAGLMLCPGLIDLQVFTGEPGQEHRETLATASRAAAAGGVTSILCMPNTDPVIDDVALVHYMEQSARDSAIVRVYPVAALTKGLQGKEITEIGLLKQAGAIAFSNGKRSVANAQVMRLLLSYAKDFDVLVLHHTEDHDLADGGVMNEGEVATRLGLQGIPDAAETIILERDLRLVALTNSRYHASVLSSAQSLLPIERAKAQGHHVTCGVAINNLCFTDRDIGAYRTFYKTKPPLRTEDDRLALLNAIEQGIVDVIVSNHDPKDADVKRRPFAEAGDGAIGLETMLSAALQLWHDQEIELLPLLAAMTSRPANLLGMAAGRLHEGFAADLALIDLDYLWNVQEDKLASLSRNSPFGGRVLRGKVMQTYVAGQRIYRFQHNETASRKPIKQ